MIKKILFKLAICLCAAFSLHAADSSDLDKIQGNWELKTTSAAGEKIVQRLEINKEKFVFRVFDVSHILKLYAIGKLKADKAGPFNILKITEIKAGDSEADLSPVDDDRTTIYQLRDGKLILVSNLEKERDDKPVIDTYEKVSK